MLLSWIMFINNFKSYFIKGKFFWLAFVLFSFLACEQDAVSINKAYTFTSPPHFPPSSYTFENNPITEKGFKLGRKLFFDPILSVDQSVSCGNCHLQQVAFADSPNHPFSVGVEDRTGTRNAPSLANLAFFKEFFWDGGVTHLDFVPINAIEAHFEMDETLVNVVAKLNQSNDYRALFQEAFDIDTITSPFLLHALSQFTLMMISDQSKFDLYLNNKATLSNEEMKGYEIFNQKCSSCHSGVLQTDFSYRNNGIDSVFTDIGRAIITENSSDEGKFRVPSLRNITRTAPYMHNAKFNTLEEVLQHYATNIHASPTLDPLLQNNNTVGIALTQTEQRQIITFLATLTDYEFISDDRFFAP
ncbi:MAG: cytochrome c peroxidase [Chitinophagales bacterium]